MADRIAPSPRNRLLGLFADKMRESSDFVGAPFGLQNPPGRMLMDFIGANDVASTLDLLSYGDAAGLTTGAGLGTRLKPEVGNALVSAIPVVGGALRIGPKVVGRAVDAVVSGATQGPRARQMGALLPERAPPPGAAPAEGDDFSRLVQKPAGPDADFKRLVEGEQPANPDDFQRLLQQEGPEPGAVLDLSTPLRPPTRVQQDLPRWEPPGGTTGRVERLLANKSARDRLAEWMSRGMTDEGLGWYNMEPLKEQFIARLGPEQGASAFDRYIDLMAVTSAGATTPSNARIASHYYVEGMKNPGATLPIPAKGSGYGHKSQNLHNRNANEVLQGGGLDTVAHPKRTGFAENLKGNLHPIAVDKHNVRALGMASRDPEWLLNAVPDEALTAPSFWNEAKHGPWNPEGFNPRAFYDQHNPPWHRLPPTWFDSAPKKTEYAALERFNQELAEAMGTEPARGQAALWLGAGDITGLGSPPVSMARTFDDLLKRRGKVRGESPETVLDQFIRGVRPIAAGGVATALGAGAMYGGDDRGL